MRRPVVRRLVTSGLIAAAVVVLAGGAGFAAGAALERSGTLDPVAEPDPATVRDAAVLSFDCPDGNPVVALGRADRILVTGRDEERAWVELRSPLDAAAVVWLPAAQVDLHGEVGGLPVRSCGSDATPATIPADPADDRPRTTTTTVVASSTTTTSGDVTTTTESDGSTSSTSSSTSSTTSTSTGITIFPPTTTTTTTPTTTTSSTTSTTQPTQPADA